MSSHLKLLSGFLIRKGPPQHGILRDNRGHRNRSSDFAPVRLAVPAISWADRSSNLQSYAERRILILLAAIKISLHFRKRAISFYIYFAILQAGNRQIGGIPKLYYSMISVTTPEPTVRPPSRIANRSSLSIATGVSSSTSILVLSPGMIISTPCGNVTVPVTSVVRK